MLNDNNIMALSSNLQIEFKDYLLIFKNVIIVNNYYYNK